MPADQCGSQSAGAPAPLLIDDPEARRMLGGLCAKTPQLLPPRDAARAMSISERTLFTLTKRGDLPAVRIGRSVRYDPADLQRFIDQAKTRGEA